MTLLIVTIGVLLLAHTATAAKTVAPSVFATVSQPQIPITPAAPLAASFSSSSTTQVMTAAAGNEPAVTQIVPDTSNQAVSLTTDEISRYNSILGLPEGNSLTIYSRPPSAALQAKYPVLYQQLYSAWIKQNQEVNNPVVEGTVASIASQYVPAGAFIGKPIVNVVYPNAPIWCDDCGQGPGYYTNTGKKIDSISSGSGIGPTAETAISSFYTQALAFENAGPIGSGSGSF